MESNVDKLIEVLNKAGDSGDPEQAFADAFMCAGVALTALSVLVSTGAVRGDLVDAILHQSAHAAQDLVGKLMRDNAEGGNRGN